MELITASYIDVYRVSTVFSILFLALESANMTLQYIEKER